MKEGWKTITTNEISLEKLISEYVICHTKLPWMKCKARVWERASDFQATTNIQIKNYLNNTNDGIFGLGNSEEEALNDLIDRLFDMISKYERKFGRVLYEYDYEFCDPHDF